MTPNLMLAAKKACNPLSRFTSQNGEPHQYKYQIEPVPGIYSTDREYRYLVAIKPNGKKDTDNIFAAKRPTSPHQELELPRRPHSQASNTMTWGSSTTLYSSAKSITFATTERDNNIATRNYHPNHPSSAPFEQKSTCGLLNLLRRLNRKQQAFNNITREDCFGGFRRLSKPLRIEYNTILKRWMFSSEIEGRTTRIRMCASENCMATRHTHCEWQCGKACGDQRCGILEEREMFVLDDGQSWIIVGDMKHVDGFVRKIMVQRKRVSVEKSALFYVNQWEGMTRMDNKEEAWRREIVIEHLEKRIWRIGADDEFEEFFAKVVNYFTM